MFNIFPSISKALGLLAIATFVTLPVFGQNKGLPSDLEDSFRHYNLVQLDSQDALSRIGNDGYINLSVNSRILKLKLEANDMRSRLYRAETVDEFGPRFLENASVNTYRGRIENESDSQVRLTVGGGRVEGFLVSKGDFYFVEPADRYSSKAAPGQLIIYRKEDFLGDSGFACPSDMEEKIEYGKTLVDRSQLAGLDGPGVIELEVRFTGDPEKGAAPGDTASDLLRSLGYVR